MKKDLKKFFIMILTAILISMNAMPAIAATSKYGEDKPLKSVSKSYYIEKDHGAPHKHWQIEANNGVSYLLYDSCMSGMVSSTPTNHSSTITIDGVKYSLRNYRASDKYWCSYANVIRKTGESASPAPTTTKTPSKKIPIQKITMNHSTLSLTVGNSSWLSVSYTPSNTTDNKSVTWKSGNASIVAVSNGKVTAKAAGTTTITAKVGVKKAVCKVTVKSAPSSGKKDTSSSGIYKNVSDAYKVLNKFRTSKANQWYWNANNTNKTTTYGLKALQRDVALENTAKVRAKEQWTMYYKKGIATHARPNGKNWTTAYPSSIKCLGENLAWGHTSVSSVILDPDWGWAETHMKYSDQGHRRNMLDKRFTKVGMACYEQDGKTCWAMCLGK